MRKLIDSSHWLYLNLPDIPDTTLLDMLPYHEKNRRIAKSRISTWLRNIRTDTMQSVGLVSTLGNIIEFNLEEGLSGYPAAGLFTHHRVHRQLFGKIMERIDI